ncbi:MAG: phosphoenolpyruvate carboxykinase [Actinobacteria bacterium]|nr:phosphoenolpyruvate carboxykinase [Actinomycetota bacterium]
MNRIIVRSEDLCRTPVDLLLSSQFEKVLSKYISRLFERNSSHVGFLKSNGLLDNDAKEPYDVNPLIELLINLLEKTPEQLAAHHEELGFLPEVSRQLNYFVEELYDYWRKTERFLVFEEEYRVTRVMTREYHDYFRKSSQDFKELVRETYRRISDNLTGTPFKVYRQLPSGAGAALVVEKIPWKASGNIYSRLESIPFIQQVIIEPPLIYYTKSNKRSGAFEPAAENPLDSLTLDKEEWFCIPVKIGLLKTFVYFHVDFLHLGVSLANLFELANADEIMEGNPDCLLVFGPGGFLGERKTVYYEDPENGIVLGLVSGGEDIDYFGYIKKMSLTLHNIRMIDSGRFPLHGAMAVITLNTGKKARVIIVGDSGTGKSESLEAFRSLAEKHISDLEVIFDDMGVLAEGDDGEVLSFGTEIGAFVRLDDLEPGYAYSEVDRSIFMNPQMTNARVVIPITLYDRIISGHPVDFLLYANNYDDVDPEHPAIEFFDDPESAISVFDSGKRFSKGTTDEKGLVETYFANPFGASQKKEEHVRISRSFFENMMQSGTRIGQLRTRLGIAGYEVSGPKTAAEALFKTINT